jgi:predicted alpha-1,2-mannosidase
MLLKQSGKMKKLKKKSNRFCLSLLAGTLFAINSMGQMDPVDYVNPYIGNISHLLVPTYPTVHLPNSLVRMRPERASYTESRIDGLQVMTHSHRTKSAFRISCYQGDRTNLQPVIPNYYDNEVVKPYFYSVYLDRDRIGVQFAPSHQSAMYQVDFEGDDKEKYLVFHTQKGELKYADQAVSGYEDIGGQTKVYWYASLDTAPAQRGYFKDGTAVLNAAGKETPEIILSFGKEEKSITIQYGISFISIEQARRNLEREIAGKSLSQVANAGRSAWNSALSKIEIKGGTEDQRTVFYTSLYRTHERMINISEDGKYWSGFDKKVHDDHGTPFYTDDWVWDTYLATHPLRTITDPSLQQHIVASYIRMAQQNREGWVPTFPSVFGDRHAMNGNHAVSLFLDAANKGIPFDMEAAYMASKKTIMEESHIPWYLGPAGEYDAFYREHGYFPGLHEGEEETIEGVDTRWEQRQSVAVTQGAAYDEYCLAMLAKKLELQDDYEYFLNQSYNYRNLFNRETGFFHPKDSKGEFIMPFDYKFSRGYGARHYYAENNAYTYQWNVKHNIGDLIDLMGGEDSFLQHLDQLFIEDLGLGKWRFYSVMPDQTGNVGQFSMGNEPSFHIPYLYNYAGRPWETQKRIRSLLDQWFRNDLMGVPGDEDGGGMSAFVVFSAMGFYPVTPGLPEYTIGSPQFSEIAINLENGKVFKVIAHNASEENKYIRSARLNGKLLDRPFIQHQDIMDGSVLEMEMGNRANREWGTSGAAR